MSAAGGGVALSGWLERGLESLGPGPGVDSWSRKLLIAFIL